MVTFGWLPLGLLEWLAEFQAISAKFCRANVPSLAA